jgi:hypothetical protein
MVSMGVLVGFRLWLEGGSVVALLFRVVAFVVASLFRLGVVGVGSVVLTVGVVHVVGMMEGGGWALMAGVADVVCVVVDGEVWVGGSFLGAAKAGTVGPFGGGTDARFAAEGAMRGKPTGMVGVLLVEDTQA